VKVLPATALDLPALVEMFNAGFSEYLVPMTMDERGMRDYLEVNGIELDCSRVVVEEHPVAFTLIAVRGAAAWVAGMGTVPARRGQGLGERVLLAGIEAARERECRTLSLEVIDRNLPAVGLYRKLGFEPARDLLVWSLEPTDAAPPGSRAVEPEIAHRWIIRNRRSPEPWQRSDEVVQSLRSRGAAVFGLQIEHGDAVAAAALVVQREEDLVSVLQIATLDADADAAGAALLAAGAGKRTVRLTNVPEDDPASRAMRQLGGRLVLLQHELMLRL
jgi:GNAT superfamily N-acetyltransferase